LAASDELDWECFGHGLILNHPLASWVRNFPVSGSTSMLAQSSSVAANRREKWTTPSIETSHAQLHAEAFKLLFFQRVHKGTELTWTQVTSRKPSRHVLQLASNLFAEFSVVLWGAHG
jgi:hypothetical protein